MVFDAYLRSLDHEIDEASLQLYNATVSPVQKTREPSGEAARKESTSDGEHEEKEDAKNTQEHEGRCNMYAVDKQLRMPTLIKGLRGTTEDPDRQRQHDNRDSDYGQDLAVDLEVHSEVGHL